MFCPSCGKEIPDNSTFCLHCGNRIATPGIVSESTIPIEWEYQDFVYRFSPGAMSATIGEGSYTEAGAKLEFWQNFQQQIRLELQKWLDQGWQPVGEVGSAGISIRTYRKYNYNIVGWAIIIPIAICTFGLFMLLVPQTTFAEPTVFRLATRRPAIPGTVKKKTVFDVVMVSAGKQKIPLIKFVRELHRRELGRELGLKEAKDLVETPDAIVLSNVDESTARSAKLSLESLGAEVELR